MIKQYYNNNKETINNFIWRTIQILGKQGITFLIFIMCAKLLSPYEFGIFNYILAIIFLIIMFSDFGISTSTSKMVAEYNSINKDKISHIFFNSLLVILSFTLLILLIILLGGMRFIGDNYRYILYLLPMIFIAPIISLYDGIYRGLKRFKQLAIITITLGIFSLPLVYFLINRYGLIGALISQDIFYFLLLIGLFIGYFKSMSFILNLKIAKDITKYALLIGLINLGYFLYTRVDIIILGKLGYISDISNYELVNRFIMLLSIPFLIAANVIAPNISHFFVKKRWDKIFNRLKKTIVLAFLISSFLGVVLVVIFVPFLKMFLPSYFNNQVLLILIFLSFVSIFQRVADFIGNGFVIFTGHIKLNLIIIIVFGILNLLLDILLVSKFGFMGILYTKLFSVIAASSLFIVIYFNMIKKSALIT